MDNLQILKTAKKAAIKAMKEKKILASFIIASSMYYMNSTTEKNAKTLFDANNIMKKKCGKNFNEDSVVLDGDKERGVRYKSYDSISDCINDWLLSFRSSTIREIWDLDTAISKVANKDLSKVNLQPFVDAYKLTDIDKEVLSELYPSNQSVVEVPTVLSNTEAYQQLSGYRAKDTRARIPGASKRQRKVETTASDKSSFEKGGKFMVKNVNIFCDPGASVASRCFSGNVWLYNGMLINGKYAIVTNKSNLDKSKEFIDGYIKKTDLK